ncbi:MAG: alpha-L-rhamnosidase N-terminal domain-containing protein, partial [Lachnospiraceae bacterium]|nr:alpha-L-rhamnosidase N-terminal domain-containing protein [Lachnospiraceae bacterium]
MKIERLRVNRLENPVGYDLMKPTVSYVVRDAKGRRQTSARIVVAYDEEFKDIVYDSGDKDDIVSTAFELPFETKSETRYYWKVSVKDDANDSAESDTAYFETAKGDAWDADWISVKGDNKVQAVMYKEIEVKKPVKKARIYMTGLGLYELNINGEKQGDERLLPGFFVYDSYLQYQTFDVSFKEGKNLIEVLMGDGWYKGNYGLVKRYENYGDRLALIAEIKLFYEDGTTEKILTDTSWRARNGHIMESGIYSGEVIDMTADVTKQYETEVIDIDKSLLIPRLSPAIKVINKIKPVELIHT